MIYSEDLGTFKYSGINLHCCFNIYKRPDKGKLNKKTTNSLPFIKICRNDNKKYNEFPYDLRMCAWGDGTAGKILSDNEHYSAEYKIKIDENYPLYHEIKHFLKTFNWKKYLNCIMRKIQQFHIIDLIKKEFNL